MDLRSRKTKLFLAATLALELGALSPFIPDTIDRVISLADAFSHAARKSETKQRIIQGIERARRTPAILSPLPDDMVFDYRV
jgi:hypothetical protein